MKYSYIIINLFCFLGLTLFSANAAPSRYKEREVIRSDSFTMLNIIPSSPGSEEVAAADAIEFVERTGNPCCLYSMSLHPQGRPAMKTVDAAVESYRKWTEHLKGSAVKPAILLQSIIDIGRRTSPRRNAKAGSGR